MLNTDNFVSKLQHILTYHNILPAAFADVIGVQRSSISHILSGRNKASIEFILKIANSYPEINLEWLLGRKTDFLNRVSSNNPESSEGNKAIPDRNNSFNPPDDIVEDTGSAPAIEKIIVFYTDKTFTVYNPA